LRRERERAARQLERAITAELGRLALPRAAFAVQLAPRDVLRADGADEVEFLFSANPGEPVRPLARVASGGEASRLWLALKRTAMVKAGPEEASTVVLDEADAGVSGAVADVVGRMVRAVAAGRQVLCITHLPQIAALASAHFRIEKSAETDTALTTVEALQGDGVVAELCRMLGAEATDKAARRHAKDLLAAA
jgi:DNA repair protein RecN (Recombination protein N)